MTDRFLQCLLTAALICANVSALANPPNILLIFSDDHGAEDMGAYGNSTIRTPNLDQLANEGLLFERAYTTEAICTPARSSLYTGMYPMRHGAHRNHTEVFEGTKSLPHYFQPLGYRVALAGKRHIGPAAAFPFDYLEASGNSVNGSQSMIAAYFDAIDAVFERSAQPFLLVVATSLPHSQPGLKDGYPDASGYDPEEVVLPDYLVDTAETRAARAGYYALVTQLDDDVGTLLSLLDDSKAADNTLVIYASDHGAGFAFEKWTNYEAGIRIPFLMRWPGNIEPGQRTDALISIVDVLPTLLEVAGGDNPGADVDGSSFGDVLAGGKHRDAIFATLTTRGIRNAGAAFPVRSVLNQRYKYIRNLNPTATFTNNVTEKGQGGWHSWVTLAANDKYAAHQIERYQHRPPEELYDLQTDPYELNNLAGEPGKAHLLESMGKQLEQWMRAQNDQGLDAVATASNITFADLWQNAFKALKNRWEAFFR